MNALEALGKLKSLDVPLVTTRDAADLLGVSVHSAGKYLESFAREKLVEKLSAGRWALSGEKLDPLQIAEFLVAPEESYISLHSALFYHGMIEQIPTRIYSVTSGRTKLVKTTRGTFSFHHCAPVDVGGFEFLRPYLKLS